MRIDGGTKVVELRDAVGHRGTSKKRKRRVLGHKCESNILSIKTAQIIKQGITKVTGPV